MADVKVAVFPGSFDPITVGHVDIIRRAAPLFDEIRVAIGENSQKSYLYPLETRLTWLEDVFSSFANVSIDHYEGLTAHYCREIGAKYMIRGLRNASDFDYEKTISQLNQIVGGDLETVFFISRPAFSHISSTIVREILKGGGDATPFIPEQIKIQD